MMWQIDVCGCRERMGVTGGTGDLLITYYAPDFIDNLLPSVQHLSISQSDHST